jgi:uncharacterized membrane protein YbaN (DUF454 family)
MDWKKGRGMTVESKVVALATAMPSMGFSALYLVKLDWVKWCIAGCAIIVLAIILTVKTKPST